MNNMWITPTYVTYVTRKFMSIVGGNVVTYFLEILYIYKDTHEVVKKNVISNLSSRGIYMYVTLRYRYLYINRLDIIHLNINRLNILKN